MPTINIMFDTLFYKDFFGNFANKVNRVLTNKESVISIEKIMNLMEAEIKDELIKKIKKIIQLNTGTQKNTIKFIFIGHGIPNSTYINNGR